MILLGRRFRLGHYIKTWITYNIHTHTVHLRSPLSVSRGVSDTVGAWHSRSWGGTWPWDIVHIWREESKAKSQKLKYQWNIGYSPDCNTKSYSCQMAWDQQTIRRLETVQLFQQIKLTSPSNPSEEVQYVWWCPSTCSLLNEVLQKNYLWNYICIAVYIIQLF